MDIYTSKIEKSAARSVEEYIDRCSRLEPFIETNDKTPIWDGDLFIYKNIEHSVENFVARIPVNIKGTTNTSDDFYRINREYLETFKTMGGGIFFLVQVNLKTFQPLRILYTLISLNDVDVLLKQNTNTIKINLKEVPIYPLDFEKEIIGFADKRNELEISSFDANNLVPLKEDCEKLRQYIHSINLNQRDYFEKLLDKTKSFIVGETFNWCDVFILNIQEIMEIAQSNHIDDFSLLRDISTKFALFLKDQKRYDLAEKYLKVAENYAQTLAEKHPETMGLFTESSKNLVNLYKETIIPDQIEKPLYLQLCEKDPTSNLEPLAREFFALAYRFEMKNSQRNAEINFINALDLYILLTEFDEKETKRHINKILEILDKLYEIHKNVRNYSAAIRDVSEAMKFIKKNTDSVSESNQILQANWLAKSAFLNKMLKHHEVAKKEYKKSLNIYDSLGEKKKKKQVIEEAQIKISFADLYSQMGKDDKAQKLFNESIETYNSLKNNKITPFIIKAFYEFAKYYARINKREEAESKYNEACKLQQELNNPDDFTIDQADTLITLASLYQQEDLNKAGETYRKALDIVCELVEKDPEATIYILRDFLNNSTTIYDSFSTSKEKAVILLDIVESRYRKLIEIYKNIDDDEVEIRKEVFEFLLYSLAHLFDISGDDESAEKEYKELLDLRRERAILIPEKNEDVALTLIDLGKLHSVHSRIFEAVNDYEEALKKYQHLSKGNNYFDNNRATLHNLLSNLYYSLNQPLEAENHFNHYRELVKNKQDKSLEIIAEILDNDSLLNISSHEYPQIINNI